MKPRLSYRWAAVLLAPIAVLSAPVAADPPNLIPITAEQAFDAVTRGVDPAEGWAADVTLIDVRDPVEIFFSGAPGRVDTISLSDGREITPDDGKVRLLHEGKFVEYRLAGRYQRLQVAKIGSLSISQLAVNIPYLFRTGTVWVSNEQFADAVQALIDEEAPYQVVILFCRSGGRSSSAVSALDATWFDAVYEIDDPAGGANFGGFTGSNYQKAYNGHVGFPGRQTEIEEHPSVSWMDSGLPIVTTTIPNTP